MKVIKFKALVLISALLCLSNVVKAQNPASKDSIADMTEKTLQIWDSVKNKPKEESEKAFKNKIIPTLLQAAEWGYPLAMYNLGTAYYFGTSGSEDKEQGIKWWRKAWENGYYDAYQRLTNAGCTSSDMMTWITDSADEGNSEAQYTLGLVYELGVSPAREKDKDKAIKYYTLAAENGQSGAMRSLGFILMYENGTGIRDEKGKPWLEKAAAAGDAEAMYYLGDWYLNEGGSHSKAVEWFQKAARNGNKKAKKMLNEKGYTY